jgi:quercetin 2,3-dioxygenase
MTNKKYCTIKSVLNAKTTLEGAGVKLKRVFGFHEKEITDPFLLLDHFGSDNPDDYMAGFPWHPHRGIETVTYMINGSVEHSDSMGNKGVINTGDVQWMTAGSGIIHQEMPQESGGSMSGFQLWVNLPASQKMMKPRYREILADTIPVVKDNDKTVKIISGCFNGQFGPVTDLVVETTFLDITLNSGKQVMIDVDNNNLLLSYVFEGKGYFDNEKTVSLNSGQLALYNSGNSLVVSAPDKSVRFILISGKPLTEPIAWMGPIVMNTSDELKTAMREYNGGTFIK